ncbi:MCE-family protein [Mycolicibacterium setense]|uniref:MCE family protein n=1 Tax=Mycolicibacterium setense TaxID=431269 RepID=UPI0007EA03B4|nr:MCE family protein [Mycolicibacterium setense]OBB17658.1 MCE-family protein [Mycolicibacterium setense]
MSRGRRALAGLATVVVLSTIVAFALFLFQGGLTRSVPLTVLSHRAGLVMNPGAKVQLLGVRVGRVTRIDTLPDGRAAIQLAMDPSRLSEIPANVRVDIGSPTVFGAKSVNLTPPVEPSAQKLTPGQVLDADQVTVEFNTTFQQLTDVLAKIQPEKLNATLGAMSSAFVGRGDKFGQTLTDLDHLLAKLNPSLNNLNHDLEVAPTVLNAYADAAPDLSGIADKSAQISKTVVDTQKDLDAVLVSATGLADIGNDVLGNNRQALTDLVHVLLPTTTLTDRYNEGLTCALAGANVLGSLPPSPEPGIKLNGGIIMGVERYRYPGNLPKVAATGGPHCLSLPRVPFEQRPPFVVGDIGANPGQYGNQGWLLNSEGLKNFLFGPLDGPPRNTAQIGQPG